MTARKDDERAGRTAEVDSTFPEQGSLDGAERRRRTVAVNILIFAAIPSMLFWAMVIMLIEGNLAGAAQLVCVTISAGYVGWNLK